MKLKGIIETDTVNYKKCCMTLEFPICKGFKCDKLNGQQVCQNGTLATEPNIEISADDIIKRYLVNPITEAICCQGLDPLDTFDGLVDFVHKLRILYGCDDTVVIYTGYNKEEIDKEQLSALAYYGNIILKFGPYLMNRPSRYDDLLGVTLASDNQYAEQIS